MRDLSAAGAGNGVAAGLAPTPGRAVMRRRSLVATATITALTVLAVVLTTERPVATQSSTTAYTAIDLGTLGGSSSVARGVGDLSFAIVGSSTTASGATHAFWRTLALGFTDLGTLGGSNSEALAISFNNTHVAGRAKLATTKYHAFRWTAYPTGRPMIDLGTLGGSESGAHGVNSWGVVVGWSHTPGDMARRAFVYRDSVMSPLAVAFGGSNSTALAINDSDHIVGQASLAGNAVSHAFLFINGVAKDLGSPAGAGTSVATAINELDQVAGYWLATNNTMSRAFIYTGGAMQTLPALGGSFAYARAIDPAGLVVGEADTSGGVRHAVRWRSGVIEDLNSLLATGSGWVLQAATGVDAYGNIVGYGLKNGQTRAFLLQPPIDVRLSIRAHQNQLDTNIPNPVEAGRSLDLGATVSNDDPHWATGVVITHTLTGPVEYRSWDSTAADCTQSGQTLTCRLKEPVGPGSTRDQMLRVRTTAAGLISHRATMRADQADPNLANNSATESNRVISLASFTLNSPVVGGKPALGRTTLTSPTGSGGSRIILASSNPAVAAVPAEFDVLPWAYDGLSREFYVTTQKVTQQTTVQISATYGAVTITNTLTLLPSTPSTPFGGTARAVPGTIQAEDFDSGGEGVAYHDTNTANDGGACRSTGVDIEATLDTGGGCDVGWIRVGEWLKFTVNVAAAGTYTLEARVASAGAGGRFHVEANGVDKTGALTVPDTGGWQSWRTVSKAVTLAAGVQVLRVAFDANGPNGAIGNINWIRLTAQTSTPFNGVVRSLPGTVQAEDFDDGGEGTAYHDTTTGNAGGAYRTKHVDIEATTDTGGGYNVGWMVASEWLKYTVNVTAAGTYKLTARVAAEGSGGTFHVEVNGVDKTGPITIPNTGGWQKWTTTVTKTVTLAAGTQVFRVVLDSNGPTGAFGNLNYVTVSP
jgi:probable HAF family extracellular repeat protein